MVGADVDHARRKGALRIGQHVHLDRLAAATSAASASRTLAISQTLDGSAMVNTGVAAPACTYCPGPIWRSTTTPRIGARMLVARFEVLGGGELVDLRVGVARESAGGCAPRASAVSAAVRSACACCQSASEPPLMS